MSSLAALGYVVTCLVITTITTRFVTLRTNAADFSLRCAVGTITLFFFFQFFFMALGAVELSTGLAVVTTGHALALASVVTLLLVVVPGARAQAVSAVTAPGEPLGTTARLVLVAASVTLVLSGLMLAFQYPRGFEVSAYHLPSAVNILQTNSLRSWDPHYPHTFPLGASIYFAFLLDVLPERMVSIGNMVFFPILGASTYAIAREAGGDKSASAIASIGVLSIPIVAFSGFELGSDIGALAFISLAILLVVSRRVPLLIGAALAGTAAGLAFGYKSLHLVSIAYLGAIVLYRGFAEDTSGQRIRAAMKAALAFGSAVALAGGFWLARNWVDFGNPLYPVSFSFMSELFGWTVDPSVDFSNRRFTQFEWVRSTKEWLAYPWIEWQAVGQNFKFSAGLGAYFAAAIPPTLLVCCARALHGRIDSTRAILLCGGLTTLAVWWVLGDRQPRYLMGFIAFVAPLAAWVVTQARSDLRRWYEYLLCACILVMLFVVLTKEFGEFGSRVLRAQHGTRAEFYEYPARVDLLPPGSIILNLSRRTAHYPLFGKEQRNRVISTPRARHALGLPGGLGAVEWVKLTPEALQPLGVTHVYYEETAISLDSCIRLIEIERLESNPGNGIRLPTPRTLAKAEYCR